MEFKTSALSTCRSGLPQFNATQTYRVDPVPIIYLFNSIYSCIILFLIVSLDLILIYIAEESVNRFFRREKL